MILRTAVQCRGIVKEFGSGEARARVLRGIDLDVPLGELTLLVGPSGCGKTTLLSVIAGLLDATSGHVEVLGQPIAALSNGARSAFRRSNLGFVFQQYHLLPALTAAENAAVPLLAAGVRRKEAVERATAVLDSLGLADHAAALPAELSGGQQQRVALARALVHNPRLILCDEPTAALDAASGRAAMELLASHALRSDRAVIVVTHDSRVFHYGDRIVSMNDGGIAGVEFTPERKTA